MVRRPLRGHRHRSTTPGTPAAVAVVLAVAVLVAACGSQVAPETVATAGGRAGGQEGQSAPVAGPADLGGPGAPEGPDPGPAPDPATGSVPDDAAPAAPGPGADPGSGEGATGGDEPEGGGRNAPSGDSRTGSCEGFTNQTGITDKVIRLGNAADISGPVPGIFQGAQDGARAYAAYFNSRSDICGRKLEIVTADSRADNAANEAAARQFCSSVFAAVGSMSAFDAGGSETTQKCGLPDIRSTAVDPARNACTTCFSAQAVNSALVNRAVPRWFARRKPAAVKRAATLHVKAGAAPINAKSQAEAWRRSGVNVVYEAGIDVSEFNYAPYVQQLQNRDITWVQYVGPYQYAVRLAQAMQQQNVRPDFFVLDLTGYDPRYIESGGDAVEGTYVWMPTALIERPDDNEEMALYQAWLQQVKPGAIPDSYGLFAWSATRLFVERATELGGKLTRESLVKAVRGVRKWTANALHSPQDVGGKRTTECYRILRLQKGTYVQESAGDYLCEGLVNTGIGG